MAVSDLTGTKWVLNENIEYDSSFPTYYITYKAYYNNGADYDTGTDLHMAQETVGRPPSIAVFYGLLGTGLDNFAGNMFSSCIYEGTDTTMTPITGVVLDYIEITGGTDATNATLIAWLEANGTLIAPVQANTYELIHSLTNLSHGNITIQITPDTGYTYPTSLTITNGTLVSYDNTTGIAVISGDDTTIVNGECVVASAITCTVSGLGSVNPSDVVFTKDANFTKAGLGIEDITLNGNVFVKIPKLYRKVNSVSDGQITSFTISTAKFDNDYQPYPCFVDENGNELDYVLIGKYFNKNSSGMNSVASGSSVSQTLATARPYARSLGTGYQLYDWMMMRMWQDLIICIMETVDTNNGSGLATDALGISWETAGFWVDGVIKGTTEKWWICNKPSSYVSLSSTNDGIPTDYVATDYSAPTSSYWITKLGYDTSKPFANFVAAGSITSYTQYYCDSYYCSSGSHPFNSSVGRANADCGAFSSYVNSDWSASRCVRLCYRPLSA